MILVNSDKTQNLYCYVFNLIDYCVGLSKDFNNEWSNNCIVFGLGDSIISAVAEFIGIEVINYVSTFM